jgi:hypothetical protein
MKLNKLALACAMTLAAGQALAHGPSVTPDLKVFISGSSALQGALGKIAEGMMTAGTIDVYYDTASNGSNYRAYFGTVSGTGTALDGKKVLLQDRAAGGSFQGVGPLARAQAITQRTLLLHTSAPAPSTRCRMRVCPTWSPPCSWVPTCLLVRLR